MSSKFLDYSGLSYLWGKLKTLLAGKQDALTAGSNIDITNNVIGTKGTTIWLGTCSTAASTQAKAVTISGITALTEGLCIRVIFEKAQSYNGNPTLNLNNLGAISIKRYGTQNAARYDWAAGEILDFVYNGTYWVRMSGGTATTNYLGMTKLTNSTTSTSTTTAATPSSVKTAYDLASGKQDALVSGTNIKTINNTSLLGEGNIAISVPTAVSQLTNDSGFLTLSTLPIYDGSVQ